MTKFDITPQQEKELLQQFFDLSRNTLFDYFEERDLNFSNSQLFAFILVSPITIAIASDGNVDFTETTMLVDIASYFERGILPTELDGLGQPVDCLSDKEFCKMIYSELRFLCLSMPRFEKRLLDCIKALIRLDETLSRNSDPKYSIKKRVVQMMNSVIYNNLGTDSIEEKKISHVLNELNLNA